MGLEYIDVAGVRKESLRARERQTEHLAEGEGNDFTMGDSGRSSSSLFRLGR